MVRVGCIAACLLAIHSAGAQRDVPVKTIAVPKTRSVVTVASVYPGLRALSGGRVLLNDQVSRRIMMFDSTLKIIATPFDSAGGGANSYGSRSLGLIPHRGDTTYVAEPTSMSFLVLNGSGNIVRVEASPRTGDMGLLAATGFGFPRFDLNGRLIYRTTERPPTPRPLPNGGVPVTQPTDSALIVRVSFDTRTVDTVARIRISSLRNVVDTLAGGATRPRMIFEVLPSIDEWTVLPDGTIAIVRGIDYHIDWYAPDGTHSSSPKLPIDWRRLTDEDKRAKVDSARATYESTRTPESRARAAATNGPQIDFVAPSELPDYVPPVRPLGVKADTDGNVWILPSTSSFAGGPRGLMYDVVNRKGEMIQRVRFPDNRVLAGFGEDGVVYMLAYEGGQYYLERSRVR